MTALIMMAIAVFGVVAYRSLAISDLPTVDYPTVNVSASLPGASPQTMAAAVATPLEKQFSTIAGIDNMTSSSSLGSTQITIQFSLSRDIDAAAQDVQAAIAKTLRQLPPDIQPPSYQKSNPAASPIQFFALTSPTLSLQELDRIGETMISQRLSTVDGVAAVRSSVRRSMPFAFSSTRLRSRIARSTSKKLQRRSTTRTRISRPASSPANRRRTRSRRRANCRTPPTSAG